MFKTEKIDFVKIDVQGVEGEILKGMEKIIDRSNISIYFEYIIGLLNKSKVNAKETINFLTSKRFNKFEVLEVFNREKKLVSKEYLLNHYDSNDNSIWANVFCSRDIKENI